jgi:hypothetical protein
LRGNIILKINFKKPIFNPQKRHGKGDKYLGEPWKRRGRVII